MIFLFLLTNHTYNVHCESEMRLTNLQSSITARNLKSQRLIFQQCHLVQITYKYLKIQCGGLLFRVENGKKKKKKEPYSFVSERVFHSPYFYCFSSASSLPLTCYVTLLKLSEVMSKIWLMYNLLQKFLKSMYEKHFIKHNLNISCYIPASQIAITFDIALLIMDSKDLQTIFQVIMFIKYTLSQT